MTVANEAVWHGEAEQLALERAERILQSRLPTAIAQLDDVDPDADADAKVFRAPSAEQIFLARETIDRLLRGDRVALSLYVQTSARSLSQHSSTPAHRGEVVQWTLRAALAFEAPEEFWDGYRTLPSGRTETQREATERIARRYRAALHQVLLQQLAGGAGIIQAGYAGGYGDSLTLDELAWRGRAVADVQVLQAIEIDNPRWEESP